MLKKNFKQNFKKVRFTTKEENKKFCVAKKFK